MKKEIKEALLNYYLDFSLKSSLEDDDLICEAYERGDIDHEKFEKFISNLKNIAKENIEKL